MKLFVIRPFPEYAQHAAVRLKLVTVVFIAGSQADGMRAPTAAPPQEESYNAQNSKDGPGSPQNKSAFSSGFGIKSLSRVCHMVGEVVALSVHPLRVAVQPHEDPYLRHSANEFSGPNVAEYHE
jgi:hypothetical protein